MSANKKTRAIEVLLTTSTLTEAAAKLKVNSKTLSRWLADENFREQLREARSRAFDHALSRACQAANEAVDVLLKGLSGEKVTRMEFWSAKQILDLAETVREDDVLARIESLERAVEQRQGRGRYDNFTDEQLREKLASVQGEAQRLLSESESPGGNGDVDEEGPPPMTAENLRWLRDQLGSGE